MTDSDYLFKHKLHQEIWIEPIHVFWHLDVLSVLVGLPKSTGVRFGGRSGETDSR
jgi:hypothetical protein